MPGNRAGSKRVAGAVVAVRSPGFGGDRDGFAGGNAPVREPDPGEVVGSGGAAAGWQERRLRSRPYGPLGGLAAEAVADSVRANSDPAQLLLLRGLSERRALAGPPVGH